MRDFPDPDSIRRHFRTREAPSGNDAFDAESMRRAAVLVPITADRQGQLQLILTLRSRQLRHHAGQVSFPGGSVDHSDRDFVHTALREAEEEIGLKPEQVEILGQLSEAPLPSGFLVTPIVGLIEELPILVPEPGEVDEIFQLPLSLILDPTLYQQGELTKNGIKRRFYYFDFEEYYIWGATAAMLRTLARELNAEDFS